MPGAPRMEKIVSLCRRRGFIFPSSEIYGGLNGFWDYGPLGVELKRNLKNFWWQRVVHEQEDVVGLDGSVIMNPAVWKASGHEKSFIEPLVDCRSCKIRYRVEQLPKGNGTVPCCPRCGSCDLTAPRSFHLMFKSFAGPIESEENLIYLRPETAQAIFVQFKNILDASRQKIPFGIAQVGKAFRNEINPRNFIFRSREFEQMELEYFCKEKDSLFFLEKWLRERLRFYADIGIPSTKIHVREIPEEERAFYSRKTYDLEYRFPFGTQELEGIAYRANHDLIQHARASGKSLGCFEETTRQHFIPHVVEPSAGVDRTVLALLCEAFDEETTTNSLGKSEVRTVLHLHPRMAPVKCGIFPLLRNQPALVAKAREIACSLRGRLNIAYDEAGAIGRRYRRQDEIGTPYGVTIDFDTVSERNPALRNTVTLRHRDSMQQERISIPELKAFLLRGIGE